MIGRASVASDPYRSINVEVCEVGGGREFAREELETNMCRLLCLSFFAIQESSMRGRRSFAPNMLLSLIPFGANRDRSLYR